MLSRREKQNLLYLGIGIVTGVIITGLIMYFGVISNFTKENIVKIYKIFPNSDSTKVATEDLTLYKGKQQEKKPNTKSADTSFILIEKEVIVEKDTIFSEEPSITIKADMKIAEAIIPITYSTKDTLADPKPASARKNELLIEQWDNPTNFAGYRKTQNKLIVYGIDIDNIELQSIDDNLYLIFNNKKLLLKESDSFLHYPSDFLK